MVPSHAPPLREFLGRLDEAVGQGRPLRETVLAVQSVVTEALATPGWVPERCLVPVPDCYARHLLYQEKQDRFSVVVMVWGIGQKTPIHDHGGVWCVEGVYAGRIRVTRYDCEETPGDLVAHLVEREVLDAGLGQTGALIPPVEHHTISNPFDRLAVTVHTYGGDMKECKIYLPRPDGSHEIAMKPLRYSSTPEPGSEMALG